MVFWTCEVESDFECNGVVRVLGGAFMEGDGVAEGCFGYGFLNSIFE